MQNEQIESQDVESQYVSRDNDDNDDKIIITREGARCLVYTYGLTRLLEGNDTVREQLKLATAYRNTLVKIERERRNSVRRAQAAHPVIIPLLAELALVEAKIEAADAIIKNKRKASRSRSETAPDRELVRVLKEQAKAQRATIKAAKAAIRKDVVAAIKAADDHAKKCTNEARAVSGLYWGTYSAVERGMKGLKKMDPKIHDDDGSGKLALHFQGPPKSRRKGMKTAPKRSATSYHAMKVDEVFGNNSRLRIDPVDPNAWESPKRGERRRLSRTTVTMRVGLGKNDLAKWSMVMHRPLPKGGIVTWVYMVRKRYGRLFRDELQLVVELPETKRRPVCQGQGTIAIGVGWRVRPTGVRIAYWADDSGQMDELLLDPNIISGLEKADSLRSIRDKNCNEMRPALTEWLAGQTLPEWLVEATKTVSHWRSQGRFAALCYRWRKQRFAGDDVGYNLLEAWRYHDQHLFDWEVNQRRKTLAWRREQYRMWAADVASRYATVIVGRFDLRELAKRPPAEAEQTQWQAARTMRQRVAVSTLRASCHQACGTRGATHVRAPAAWKTKKCNVCTSIETWDAAAELVHTCSSCAATWDQDENMALNLLAAWREHQGADGRQPSTDQTVTAATEPASKGRSQTAHEVEVSIDV